MLTSYGKKPSNFIRDWGGELTEETNWKQTDISDAKTTTSLVKIKVIQKY